jgi:hypothetical protein
MEARGVSADTICIREGVSARPSRLGPVQAWEKPDDRRSELQRRKHMAASHAEWDAR